MAAEIVRVQSAVLGALIDGAVQSVSDAAIVIADGKVSAAGPADEIGLKYPGLKVTHFNTGTAFPGLINGHHHIGVTTFQHGVADGPLESWIVRRIAQLTIDPYLDTLYSAFEMVASGVTTVLHLYANRTATAREMHDEARACIRAYREIGMRVSFGIMFFDQNPIGYCGDGFRHHLDQAGRGALGPWASGGDMDLAEHLAVVDSLIREFAGDHAVRIQLAPGNLQWCSDRALEGLAEFSTSRNLPVHIHFLETSTQRSYADWRARGKSPVSHLRSLGFSESRLTLGHGVWLGRNEMAELVDASVSVCHNCSSNLRLFSGIAPIRELLSEGINVALGLDEAALNDDRDMLQEMRLAMHLHKVVSNQPDSVHLDPGRLLHMATEGGAMTSDFGREIGRIGPGCSADFFIFDSNAAAYPAPAEFWTPLELLLHRGRPEHVLAVYVAGEKICENGRFAHVNREEVLAELSTKIAASPRASSTQRAILANIGRKLDTAHEQAEQGAAWFTRG